jgi:hypothetical protein
MLKDSLPTAKQYLIPRPVTGAFLIIQEYSLTHQHLLIRQEPTRSPSPHSR